MSAARAEATSSLAPERVRRPPRGLALWIVELGVGVPVTAVVAYTAATHARSVFTGRVLLWIVIAFVADLPSVQLRRDIRLSVSFCPLLAVSLIFPPSVTLVVSFVSSFDIREFRREVDLWHGLANHAQI